MQCVRHWIADEVVLIENNDLGWGYYARRGLRWSGGEFIILRLFFFLSAAHFAHIAHIAHIALKTHV